MRFLKGLAIFMDWFQMIMAMVIFVLCIVRVATLIMR